MLLKEERQWELLRLLLDVVGVSSKGLTVVIVMDTSVVVVGITPFSFLVLELHFDDSFTSIFRGTSRHRGSVLCMDTMGETRPEPSCGL